MPGLGGKLLTFILGGARAPRVGNAHHHHHGLLHDHLPREWALFEAFPAGMDAASFRRALAVYTAACASAAGEAEPRCGLRGSSGTETTLTTRSRELARGAAGYRGQRTQITSGHLIQPRGALLGLYRTPVRGKVVNFHFRRRRRDSAALLFYHGIQPERRQPCGPRENSGEARNGRTSGRKAHLLVTRGRRTPHRRPRTARSARHPHPLPRCARRAAFCS